MWLAKSIPAALLMATFQASLKPLSATVSSLAQLTSELNRYACAHSQGGQRFTTAFLAEYDLTTHRLTYINAGHNPPILCRSGGAVERLQNGGLPLGIKSEASYQPGTQVLNTGDFLVVFTDGMVEAENEGGEEFGEARLIPFVTNLGTIKADLMLTRIMQQLDLFVGRANQHDDMTCLIVRAV